MTGLQITQRLLPDQGYKELRHFITTHQQFTQFREEILGALDDSLRVSHQREDGVQHTYSPEAFTTQLISRNVPNAESIVQRLNRHMEEEYMPQFLQRIEVAMNWLLSVLEQE